MATPENWAQDVITCDVCGMPTQQFCNRCQISLCQGCVDAHKRKFTSKSHDIVPFLDRNTQQVEPRVPSVQRCEVYSENHNKNHWLVIHLPDLHKDQTIMEPIKTHEKQVHKIKKETHEIKFKIIPLYKRAENTVECEIRVVKAGFFHSGIESEKNRQLWHQEVDNIFDKIHIYNRSFKHKKLYALNQSKTSIRNLISEMTKTVEHNEKILSARELSEVNEYESKLKEYRKNPEKDSIIVPSSMAKGKKLRIEMGDFKATLTQSFPSNLRKYDFSTIPTLDPCLDRIKVFASIRSNFKYIYRMASILGGTEAWILGNSNTITRIDLNGSVKDATTCLFWPNDISVTNERELIYSDHDHRRVNIVRHGGIKNLIRPPRGWEPHSLCCSRSGDIFVHMMERSLSNANIRNKIIRYQGEKIRQMIHQDGEGNSILQDGICPIYMTQNNNEDICVSDTNAKSVVVVDKMERVRFRYYGTQPKRREPFSPKGLAADSLCQIIVSDYNNDCLHILNINGQILRCLDDCGLLKPCPVSLDSQGRLWVGLCNSGEIKVIEYLKQA
ncbi:uncharacterized protein LOC144617924 [Crassostrea virginica]